MKSRWQMSSPLFLGWATADDSETLVEKNRRGKMNFQDATDRALALRIRAKKETDQRQKQALLELAQQWEVWAADCRERAAKGEAPDVYGWPAENI